MTGRRMVGVLVLVIGAVAVAVYALGLIDPVGTKMADDADPFGPPPSRESGVIGLTAGLAIAGVGAWLALGRRPSRRP